MERKTPGPSPKDLRIKATPKQVVQAIVKGVGMPKKPPPKPKWRGRVTLHAHKRTLREDLQQ